MIAARRRIRGWMFFDWAQQPFYTLGLTFVFGPYFASVAATHFAATGLDPALADEFKYVRKQSAQLASKMRYISAQYVALLEDGLWRRNAQNAKDAARLLAERVAAIDGVRITQPVEANEIFAVLPRDVIAPLAEEYDFYVWDERACEVRWVTSWDTTVEDVERFADGIARACAGAAG